MNRWMNTANNRRRFLTESACGATALAVANSSHAAPRKTIGFREQDRYSIPAQSPRRIAVDGDGTVWLAADRSVLQIGSDGTQIWKAELERAARSLCVDDQTVFVGVRDHVVCIDRKGGDSHRLPSIGERHLIGDVCIIDHTLFATDVTAERVLELDLDANEMKWSAIHSPRRSLSTGGRLSPSAQGGFAFTDPIRHRIIMTDQSGNQQSVWGKRSRKIDGFQGCCNPMAAVELSDGSWVTAEAGQVRIKKFDHAGRFVSQIAGPDAITSPAKLSEEDPALGCGLGGIDLAVANDDSLWVLHASAKELIHYRAV